jgi:hypothetical protein
VQFFHVCWKLFIQIADSLFENNYFSAIFAATTLLGGVVILSRPPALFPPPEPAQNMTNSSAIGYHDAFEVKRVKTTCNV